MRHALLLAARAHHTGTPRVRAPAPIGMPVPRLSLLRSRSVPALLLLHLRCVLHQQIGDLSAHFVLRMSVPCHPNFRRC